jgi:hypothetical protein
MSSAVGPFTIALGTPGHPLDLARVVERAFRSDGLSARLGFAYVTGNGLDVLLSRAGTLPAWSSARKQWIVGLHHGISEPSAICRIRSIANTDVRLFLGGKHLTRDTLLLGESFHAKVVAVLSRESGRAVSLLASSSNLTGAALAAKSRNYEAGLALFGPAIRPSISRAFDVWWRQAWRAAVPATDKLVNRYASLRDAFLRRNPDALKGLDSPSQKQLSSAPVLWIEAGAMSGGLRNQVEFSEELAAFFGDVVPNRRHLHVEANGRTWTDRPLSPKTTTFGVRIWRFSLPTENAGGFRYPGTIICFRKIWRDSQLILGLDVASPGDPKAGRWRMQAQRRGHIGQTGGRRVYGFY